MIPQAFIQDLIERVDIVELIDGYVALKKRGINFWACCPFHNEKTPSFSVSANKNLYHCFGCGAHGNSVSFLMEHQGMSFVEAIHHLASHVGIEVPSEKNKTNNNNSDTKKNVQNALLRASKYYQSELKKSPRAINFLKSRGLTGAVAKKFNLGFAPQKSQALREIFQDYHSEALQQAGLVIRTEDNKIYDRFRDRVIFPIHNANGIIVGFGGRVIGDGMPKYLNSPDTIIFSKGNELYGLHHSKDAIRKIGKIIVVEGYMDVVALAQFDINCAVATLGTSISEYQIRKLLQRTDHVIFAFDGDDAGRKAADRAMEVMLPVIKDGKFIFFSFFPSGDDPDSFIRKRNQKLFWEHIAEAIPLSDFLMSHYVKDNDLSSDEAKAKYVRDIKELILRVKAPNFSLFLKKRLATVVDLELQDLGFTISKREIKSELKKDRIRRIGVPRVVNSLLDLLCNDLRLGSEIEISESVVYDGVIPKVISKDEWKLFNELVQLSGGVKTKIDLMEKYRGTGLEELVYSSLSRGFGIDFLTDKEKVLEFKGAWKQLLRQFKQAKINFLLEKADLSDADKRDLIDLQRKKL